MISKKMKSQIKKKKIRGKRRRRRGAGIERRKPREKILQEKKGRGRRRERCEFKEPRGCSKRKRFNRGSKSSRFKERR